MSDIENIESNINNIQTNIEDNINVVELNINKNIDESQKNTNQNLNIVKNNILENLTKLKDNILINISDVKDNILINISDVKDQFADEIEKLKNILPSNLIVSQWYNSQHVLYEFNPIYIGESWASIINEPDKYGIFKNVSLLDNDIELPDIRYNNFNWTEDDIMSYELFENYPSRNLDIISDSLALKLNNNSLFNNIKHLLSIDTNELYRGIYIMIQKQILNNDLIIEHIEPNYLTLLFNPSNNNYTGKDLLYKDQSNCLNNSNVIQYLIKYKIEEKEDRILLDLVYLNNDYNIYLEKEHLNLNNNVPLISWNDTNGTKNTYRIPKYNNLPINFINYSVGSVRHYEFKKNLDNNYSIDFSKFKTDELGDGTLFGIPNLTSLANKRNNKGLIEKTEYKIVDFVSKDCSKEWFQ